MESWLGLAENALRAVRPGLPDFDRARCLPARHQGGNCTACRDACPRGALGDGPVPRADVYSCDGCSVCVAVCPTGALRSGPLATAVEAWLEAIAGSSASAASVRCERAVELVPLREDDPAVELILPCLGALRATDIVAARARGASEIRLCAPDCATCDRAPAGAAAAAALIVAVSTLSALDVQAVVQRITIPGSPAAATTTACGLGRANSYSRRGLFELWRDRARRTVVETLRENESTTQDIGSHGAVPIWRERLGGDIATLLGRGDGGVAALPVELGVGLPTVEGACDGCGLCALVCPFRALAVVDARVSCQPASCTACGLCAGVCPTGGLVLRPVSPQGVLTVGPANWEWQVPATANSQSGLAARAVAADRRVRDAARNAVVRPRAPVE